MVCNLMKRTEFKRKVKPISSYKCKNSCGQQAKLKAGEFRFCSYDCATEFAQAKVVKKVKADNKKKKDDYYKSDLPSQHTKTQKVFNRVRKKQEYLRFAESGIEPECMSCGKTKMDWCCGHYKTVGSSKALRYDEINTYLQCNNYCNRNLSGNIAGNATTRGYTQGLLDQFGKEDGQTIIDYCNRHQSDIKKWTCEEVEAIRKHYLNLEKELDKLLENYNAN